MNRGHPEVKDLKRWSQVVPTGIGHRDGGPTSGLSNNWAGQAHLRRRPCRKQLRPARMTAWPRS